MKFCNISGYAASPLLSIGYFKLLFRLPLPLLFLYLFKLFCTKKRVSLFKALMFGLVEFEAWFA